MAYLERASPALKEILLKLYRSADKSTEIDHHLYEFGSVEYHIQSSTSDEYNTYLSISTPLLSQEVLLPYGISLHTKQMVTAICPDVIEIMERQPAKEGYQLTLKLDFSILPNGKDSLKIIPELSAVQATILSSQLKEILTNVNSHDSFQGMYKPIKLVYRPSEPFFIIRQPQKIIAVFPIQFKDKPDVIIATTFFQELMDVGSSEKWAKAPHCCWSPIPPPELRGELFEDLSTTGGFVSFEIYPRHVKGKKLHSGTVWSLLNFYAYVKFHVKSARSFIQRRMRKRLEGFVELLHKPNIKVEDEEKKRSGKVRGFKCTIRIANLPKLTGLKQRCNKFSRTIKRIRSRIRIHGFSRFRHRWLKIPKFTSSMGYTRLQ
ncbi:LOW QUALITY PROTEIN: actin-related protein 2/3 complex subunit 2B [Argentina anserina]|uniref:LOW QUALITY PROTEIN: actin-related protein 2/3 complex subunit 2B n=1 Tax=Argentina anserina TaxID=57926 RepID=UPI0021768D99|nr:LOW QUALITY PROTEIN: actin-related protein 2/3 complex subunit 2B [Potentilla anserina]